MVNIYYEAGLFLIRGELKKKTNMVQKISMQ